MPEMPEKMSNSADALTMDALQIALPRNTESAHISFTAVRLIPAPDDALADHPYPMDNALSGLERWEAEHGLGQDDV